MSRDPVLKRKLGDAEEKKTKYLADEVERAVNKAHRVSDRSFAESSGASGEPSGGASGPAGGSGSSSSGVAQPPERDRGVKRAMEEAEPGCMELPVPDAMVDDAAAEQTHTATKRPLEPEDQEQGDLEHARGRPRLELLGQAGASVLDQVRFGADGFVGYVLEMHSGEDRYGNEFGSENEVALPQWEVDPDSWTASGEWLDPALVKKAKEE